MVKDLSEFAVGTKNYDTDWYLKYSLSYKEAAQLLRSWGFTFIMTQSRDLPMPDSAVRSEVTPEKAERYNSYNDSEFREALATEGIGYWPTLCTFFNPLAVLKDPNLRPIDENGTPMEMMDWYLGATPTHETYVNSQIEVVANVVEKLQPDGIFLSFIRWPGFWELWMPLQTRDDFHDYSYDKHSLMRFTNETGCHLPILEPKQASHWINKNALNSWISWKCKIITDIVRQIRYEVKLLKPDIQIMINTLPFRNTDYDGARKKTFGQDLELLSEVVDIFEVMTYHQILNRPISWIQSAAKEVKQNTGKTTYCTIQTEPLYLDGIHMGAGRSNTINDMEFSQAVNAVESSNLDGVVVFVWSDLLKKAFLEKDSKRVEILRTSIVNRENKRTR